MLFRLVKRRRGIFCCTNPSINPPILKSQWLAAGIPPPAAAFGAALTLVTWVVVEVERVSAVALNMLVSTSFPAEPPVICRTESSGISRATTGEPPVLAPEEWDLPTGMSLLSQAREGREQQGKEKTLYCASNWI